MQLENWQEESTEKLGNTQTIAEEERQQPAEYSISDIAAWHSNRILATNWIAKFAHKNCPKGLDESEGSNHIGMDAQTVLTFAPTTPQQCVQRIARSYAGSPTSTFVCLETWAATRQKLQSLFGIMDFHPVLLAQGLAMPLFCRCILPKEWVWLNLYSFRLCLPSTWFGEFFGAHQGKTAIDEIRKDRSSIPKLGDQRRRCNILDQTDE